MIKSPEIFIVSSGRSGTTLLVSILNATKQVFIPYESDFIARAYPSYAHRNTFSSLDYSALVDIFYRSSQPEGWGMEKSYIYEHLYKHNPQTFAEVHSTICHAYHEQQGTARLKWGIKAPVLIASLDRIKHVYPNSKIVHIIRDGRDVYLSYKKVHQKSPVKFGPKTLLENALYWVDGLRRVEEFVRDNQVYELKYEDMLMDAKKELSGLCEFLGVNYDKSIHEKFQSFERNQELIPTKLVENLHGKVQSGLDSSNSKKYKIQMTPVGRYLFEILTLPYLARYRYDIEFPIILSMLFAPLRSFLYTIARLLNNWRYNRRDSRISFEGE